MHPTIASHLAQQLVADRIHRAESAGRVRLTRESRRRRIRPGPAPSHGTDRRIVPGLIGR